MEAHWPAAQDCVLGIQSNPPLLPTYMSGPTKARVKIGLCRVALAMKSTVGVAAVGLLTRAISVGAVVLRFKKPRYSAPVVGSRAAPLGTRGGSIGRARQPDPAVWIGGPVEVQGTGGGVDHHCRRDQCRNERGKSGQSADPGVP